MGAEENLKRLGIDLPPAAKPVANYVTSVRVGDTLYTSGHLPPAAEGLRTAGKLGRDLTVEEGYKAARATALAILATARAALGSLDRIARVVKVVCLVNALPEFTEHPRVANGCSDLLAEVFGEEGRGVRTAFGAGSLPNGAVVEIEALFQIRL
jgi:enamine deaminase RidA (YjgF/YER057c/UK114 family)